MTDAEIKERARQVVREAFGGMGNRILTIDGRLVLAGDIAAAMRETAAQARLEEALLIRDEYLDQGGWELGYKPIFDKHIAELEAVAEKKNEN